MQTDAVVRDLLDYDQDIIDALFERWGRQVLNEASGINRQEIAKRVFSDPKELQWLESTLHPRVRETWKGRLAAAPKANWLVEIPLLFEKSLESEFNFTVCIHSPDALVASRMEARGFTREELDRRRRSQMPINEKMRRADYVITNAGSLEFLQEQSTRLISHLIDGWPQLASK